MEPMILLNNKFVYDLHLLNNITSFSQFGYLFCNNRKEAKLPLNGVFTKVFQTSGEMEIIKMTINHFLEGIRKQ